MIAPLHTENDGGSGSSRLARARLAVAEALLPPKSGDRPPLTAARGRLWLFALWALAVGATTWSFAAWWRLAPG